MKRLGMVLLGLVLLLGACSSGDGGGDSNLAARTLSGNLASWDGGEAAIVAEIEVDDETGSRNEELARGTLNADGSFSLALPATVNADFLFQLEEFLQAFGCGGVSVVPRGLAIQSVVELFIYEGDNFVNSAEQEVGDDFDSYVFRIYADQDATVRGTCLGGYEEVWDLDLEEGWNIVVATSTETEPTFKTRALPANANWVLGFGFGGPAEPLGTSSSLNFLR